MGNNQHYIIAIDGPSGTGKSTTAKLLAEHLGLPYLDTGAMYRAVTWACLEAKVPYEKELDVIEIAGQIQIDFSDDDGLLIDGVVRESEIRTPRVSSFVSHYCKIPEVRELMTQQQRSIGSLKGCILDGRDIGTVVFPNADFKFFLVTDVEVRAKRRFEELQAKGEEITFEEVRDNLLERDRIDSSRATAPLVQAEDAILVDTTQFSIEEQVEHILKEMGVVTLSQS